MRTVRQIPRATPSGFDFLFCTRPRALGQQTPPEPVLIHEIQHRRNNAVVTRHVNKTENVANVGFRDESLATSVSKTGSAQLGHLEIAS